MRRASPAANRTRERIPGGEDSHYAARISPMARRQKAEFLKPGGAVSDVCGTGPCEGQDDDTP